jgi:single-stranded DNA-binding protein
MANSTTMVVNLGADPETIQLGEKEGRKLRVAEKARGKRAQTRWLNAIVTGFDTETADRLRKGDSIILTGELVLEEYAPRNPKYKGEKVRTDSMPFAKILQVVRSPSFFKSNEYEDTEATGTGVTVTDAPDLLAVEDPFAGVE